MLTLNFGTGRDRSAYLDHSLRGLGSLSSPTGGNPESWNKYKKHVVSQKHVSTEYVDYKIKWKKNWAHRHTEMHSIVSVNFLCNSPNDRVLDKFVAFPLQTDSFLCFCPTVWIHPTTKNTNKNN